MGITRRELASILRVLAVTLDGLDDQQLIDLIQGKGKLVYREENSSGVIPPQATSPKLPLTSVVPVVIDPRVDNLIARLNQFSSREEAVSFLVDSKLTKTVLLDLCKSLKIHTIKSDTKDRLIQKIVESLIGARLRSEAIKLTDLKGN